MSRLADVVAEFADELGGPPRLGEFLEILGLSVPTNNTAASCVPMPLPLTAKTAGNHVYRDAAPSRVAQLNDAAFVEASEALARLAEQVAAATGQPVSATELADAIHRAIHDEGLRFADIAGGNVAVLTVEGPNRKIKARPGDVIAIPVP